MQRPFVGRAGQLFIRLLDRVGIERSACYIDNVFQERPPGNDVTPWLDLSKKYVVENACYRENVAALKQRLKACTANVLVAVGGTALYALTGQRAITKRRGSILKSTLLPGRKVIPIIHPSAALRTYLDTHLIAHDLRRIVDQSFTEEINLLDRELLTEPSYRETIDFIEDCRRGGHDAVAYDIEVTRGEVSHLSLSPHASRAISIPFLFGGKNYFTPDQEAQIWREIAGLLEDTNVPKVGQNLSFDATFLFRKFGIRSRPLHDTMIAQAIIFPDFPKGLDFIQSMYCEGEPYYKDEGKEWFRYSDGEAAFRRYSAMDSAIVAEIWPKQIQDLKTTGNWDAYERQKGLLEPLVFIGERGIRMNTEGLTTAAKDAEERIAMLERQLTDIVGDASFNWRSVPQLKKYFYGTLGLHKYTRRGSVTTDDKALKRMAAKGIREAEVILELRHISKLRGTYYTMQLDTDGRLRCSFNPVGTKQGRISSSKTIFGTGGNLQNQPSDMKKLMLADDGHIVISMDLSQAENRVVGYIAPEPKMINAFETGIDIHRQTAAMIYGVDIEEVTLEQRSWGKRANHGLNYDLGYKSFALYYQIPEAEASFLVERYHSIYPGVRQWHSTIQHELGRTRTLTNLFGRRRTFMEHWGDALFKEAYSYIPQSTVAEMMNQWGFRYIYERQDLFKEVELLNTVHDSVIFQIPRAAGWHYIADVILAAKRNLEQPLTVGGMTFNVPVDTKVGYNLDEDQMLELKAKQLDGVAELALADMLQKWEETTGGTQAEAGGLD
jgi:DNA polymerase-1